MLTVETRGRTAGLDGKHHLNFVQRRFGCCAGVHHVEHAGPALADHGEQRAEPAGAVRDGDLYREIRPAARRPWVITWVNTSGWILPPDKTAQTGPCSRGRLPMS